MRSLNNILACEILPHKHYMINHTCNFFLQVFFLIAITNSQWLYFSPDEDKLLLR